MLKPFYHKKNCLSSLLAPCCAPFFVKRKPFAFFFSSFAGKLTSRGSRRRRHDAPHRAKSLFWSIIKTRRNKSGFYGGETGICSCLLQSNPCEIFLCFAKAFGQPLKTTHRVVFLTLSFKSLLLSVVKQKRTSEFACPFCLAEKQGFEPWLRFSRTTPLAGEPLRPLGYFSLNRKRITKDA